jgi:mRNA-degrading endonuclease RelE of RelBE toxin-antitoxin system
LRVIFVETQEFTRAVATYFSNDQEYATFQDALMSNPERGSVIQRCGGIRKIRWRDLRRGKGKRGGLRIIYLHVAEVSRILLLDVYDKDETDDLTNDERRILAEIAIKYREEVITGGNWKGR